MESYIAIITCFAGNYAPRGWLTCDGQLLSVAQNQAMFSLLGTTYGGDGVSTFALPDLRGRTPVSAGQSGVSNYALGQKAGAETTVLTIDNLPSHNHNGNATLYVSADSSAGSVTRAVNSFPAQFAGAYAAAASSSGKDTMLAPDYTGTVILPAGEALPIDILSPYLTVTYIICMQGIFPTRN
jgi:microcystin-dependent protein